MNIFIQKVLISIATTLMIVIPLGWGLHDWQYWLIFIPFNTMLLVLLYL